MKYDYLIVGAGLFGATFAREVTDKGLSALVIDKRSHISGNIYTEDIEGIQVLKKYYYANRNGHDRFNDTYNMNLYDIGTFTANFGYGEQAYIDNIDKTVEKGAWTVKMNHWLTKKEQDTHHSQKHETFLPECAYLAEQQKKNNLWVCSMNDMIKYIYVRDNSKVVIEDGMLWLESDLDKEIFDAPVTVIVDDKCYNVCLGEKISIK